MTEETMSGFHVLAEALEQAGIRYMCGVVGIPVTALAPAVQARGIRFVSFRNEQAAAYAACAVGFLTGVPGALLTVSGPGAVHGLAGILHATANRWPMIMISGSCDSRVAGRGAFQELDQVALCAPHAKYAERVTSADDLVRVVRAAVNAASTGVPGSAYIDVPSDVLRERIDRDASGLADSPALAAAAASPSPALPLSDSLTEQLAAAAARLCAAERPLLVFGKGAALSRAEEALRDFVEATGIPFVATPMGKGVVADSDARNAGAARSLVLAQCDVCLVVGARLNWLLHFGDAPKWHPDCEFIVVDVDVTVSASTQLCGHAPTVVAALTPLCGAALSVGSCAVGGAWRTAIAAKVAINVGKMGKALATHEERAPMSHQGALVAIRKALAASLAPDGFTLVSEGANTMDLGRTIFTHEVPRQRLDAGTWGTMGVGLGFAVAAALCHPERICVAVEGDSAFGFSGMEVETLVRYALPCVVIVFNNGGIYGGARDGSRFEGDPSPTVFVEGIRYDRLMESVKGDGYHCETPDEVYAACCAAFALRRPALINAVIDPMSGTESGSMQSHN